jgi:hypothetical protein
MSKIGIFMLTISCEYSLFAKVPAEEHSLTRSTVASFMG